MKNKNILHLIILVILICVILIAFALLKVLPKYAEQNVQNNATTTENAPFSNTTEEGYSLYKNIKYGFSILHPTSLSRITPNGSEDDLDISYIFVGSIPKDTFTGTNLYEVRIIAGAKATDKDTCFNKIYGNSVYANNSKMIPENVKINDIDFTKITFSEGAAGSVYRTTRYSTYSSGLCFELMAVAHSGNIGIIQETNPDIKEYDEKDFMNEFEEIVSSFKFLKNLI